MLPTEYKISLRLSSIYTFMESRKRVSLYWILTSIDSEFPEAFNGRDKQGIFRGIKIE